MRAEFQPHNLFRRSTALYLEADPHLSALKEAKYIFAPPLAEAIPVGTPGIYILTGGRQVGKTTSVKLVIKRLLEEHTPPRQILYVPCDLISGYRELLYELNRELEATDRDQPFFLFLDEITYVKEWDRTVKHFADLGYFRMGSLLVTGSDSVILRESMKKFPGRRGVSGKNDFHCRPLSFAEYATLVAPELRKAADKINGLGPCMQARAADLPARLKENLTTEEIREAGRYFDRYLLCGGFLPAINEYEAQGEIGRHVYQTYQQWVLGDFLKRNKKERFLKEIIATLGERLAKQVTSHGLASLTEIQHHSTVQEYLRLLEDMDVIIIQQALREDKLKPAPKKAKKIHFSDPFIAHALLSWARDEENPWTAALKTSAMEGPRKQELAEGCLSSLMRRRFRTCYIKAEGEVDIAILQDKGFLPVEIKWTEDLKRSELKQILKYKSGIVGYKGDRFGSFEQLAVIPASILALLA